LPPTVLPEHLWDSIPVSYRLCDVHAAQTLFLVSEESGVDSRPNGRLAHTGFDGQGKTATVWNIALFSVVFEVLEVTGLCDQTLVGRQRLPFQR